ncbi:MAG: hypothetical protein ABI743_07265 [bacterium]
MIAGVTVVLLALLWVMRPHPVPVTTPSSELISEANGTESAGAPPAATPESTTPAATASGPVLLGIQALTAEFKIDELLRLEIPGPFVASALKAAEQKAGAPIPVANLEYWELPEGAISGLTTTRVGQWFSLVSPFLEYTAPVQSFELWHDPACDQEFLIATFPVPQSQGTDEETLWVAMPDHAPQTGYTLEDTVVLHQPPPMPEEVIGKFEQIEQRVRTELGITTPMTEVPDDFNFDVRVFRLSKDEASGILGLGTIMSPDGHFARARTLLLFDHLGNARLSYGPDAMQFLGAETPWIESMVDLDHDGRDEAIVSGTMPTGAKRIAVWKFGDGGLEINATGSWWGCDDAVPAAPTEPVHGGPGT